ncbi:winged helix-turn-helix domain-containing protein [Mariniluteicoccus flavus]
MSSAEASPAAFQRPRLYEQLADHITSFIEAQGLGPGDRLPPERALAAELGVSRTTLSRALVALEVRGRVEVQHGNGAVILDPAARQAGPLPWVGSPADELLALAATLLTTVVAAAAEASPSAREALLAPDGRPESWGSVWPRLRRLAGDSALTATLDALGRLPEPDPAALADLCGRVRRGRADEAATAARTLWG